MVKHATNSIKHVLETLKSEPPSKPQQILSFSFSFAIMGVLFSTYKYLGTLDNCSCIVNNNSVKHLKDIEFILVVIITIGLLFRIYYFVSNTTSVDILKKYIALLYLLGLYIIGIIGLYIYFLYNAYIFITTLPKNCTCAQKWQIDVIYVQSIIYLISLIAIVIIL